VSAGSDFQNVLAHLAAIIESANDAVIGESLDGVITSWNQGAEHLFGFRAEEIIGENAARLRPGNLQNEGVEILQRIAEGERVEHFDTVRKQKEFALLMCP
jgi:PAS domain S-box-containing protein